jgi:thiamine-monophosphate kinase
VLRLGAKPGDRLYASGTIGDACLGLRLLREPGLGAIWGLSEDDVAFLVNRYRRPGPNNHLALLVRNFAQAAIDVSDGLVGDIEKLCEVSHVGANIETARVPFSPAARKVLARAPDLLPVLITAGDDYCVVAAVSETSGPGFESEAEAMGAPFTQLGKVLPAGAGLNVVDAEGHPLELKHKGFRHF